MTILYVLAGIIAGGAAAYFYFRKDKEVLLAELSFAREQNKEVASLREEKSNLLKQLGELRADVARANAELEGEKTKAAEQLQLWQEAEKRLSDAFNAMCGKALANNNSAFLTLAKENFEKIQEAAKGELEKRQQAISETVQPVKETLKKVDEKIQELEVKREGAYKELRSQVGSLIQDQVRLREETSKLVHALKTPSVRGRWGEIQLRRVVELAGMVSHCDFIEQQSVSTEDGRIRPDMCVRLPGSKTIIIDAKVPLEAYIRSLEAPDDETRTRHLIDHGKQIRNHLSNLKKKAYWEQFQSTPEFVVLFLPGENFLSAALQVDPSLLESMLEGQVILATPTTLIGLLKAAHYGWQEQTIAENARQISELGKELFKRVSDMAEHWHRVGKNLSSAVQSYNEAVGTLETRVLVTGRKFKKLDPGSAADIPQPAQIDKTIRLLQTPEMTLLPEEVLTERNL